MSEENDDDKEPGPISVGDLKDEVDQLRREVQDIKRVIHEILDPGRVGKRSPFNY
ncbi:hypothetical protein AB8A05_10875 [Tardiphaga sp. 538_B7_N1_4]|uniref:hypothetical protein n=1 Tax=Tardiphaga sp. 538_B7_N1_4 TaxID=3240778 RepID=UPI003F215C2D